MSKVDNAGAKNLLRTNQCFETFVCSGENKLCVMTLKNDEKFEEELIYRFKTDIRNLINFDSRTWKSQKFTLKWAAFD